MEKTVRIEGAVSRNRLNLWLAALLAAVVLLAGCASGSSSAGRGSATPGIRSSTGAAGVGSGLAPGSTDPASGLPVVALASLPRQAAETVALIRAGGPFPYRQDGAVYHNNNRVLPKKSDGYYHEYTVKTPGAKTRGARRIIHGTDNEYYWTADHYDSFRRIA